MGHSTRKEQGRVFNTSGQGRNVVLPFKRILRPIGNSNVVTVPDDYVKNFNLKAGTKYQFYLEVQQ